MLNFKVADLSEVDEAHHALYEQTDDGYQLKVDGIDDAGALKRAKDHEKQARIEAANKAKALQKELDDLKAAATASQEAATKAEQEAARKAGDVDALEKSWSEKLSARESELRQETAGLQQQINTLLVDNVASTLSNALAVKGSAEVLTPHIKQRLGVDIRDGKPTTVVLDTDGKPSALTLDELKAEISATAAFAPIIAQSQGSGSGATRPNSSGGAVKKRGDMTPSEKAEFVNKNGQDAFLKLPR